MLQETFPDLEQLGATDPSRLCPIFAGPAMVDGDQVTVRLADREISINAPRSLLKKVFVLCDGTRSVDELVATLPTTGAQIRTRSFIEFLLESGALIDACYYSLTSSRFAIGNNPFGQPAIDNRSEQIGRRFSIEPIASSKKNLYSVTETPFTKQFAGRSSTYTFDEQPILLSALNTLLWSLAGIVDGQRERSEAIVPRRTIPSAGAMHLLQVYVVIQKELGPNSDSLTPGVYRLRYPAEGLVQYDKISDDLSLLPRTVAKPGCLSFSTGMIFLAADARLAGLRYRNRSIQYLFTEAGMALQNGALAAANLGFGFVAFGSYYEAIVKQLCGLSDELIVGSAIFGSSPTNEQQAQLIACPKTEFSWADAPSELFTLPYFVGRTQPMESPLSSSTWGRDIDPALAWRKAIAEAIERQGFREPNALKSATFLELDNPLDPRRVAQFRPAQYRARGFPYKPFDPAAAYLWATGSEYGTEKPVSVLADLVYSQESLQQLFGYNASYWRSNPSGCAAGTTETDARLAAILELIERDAFMRHWLKQSPGTEIPIDSLPAMLRYRVKAIIDTGFEVVVQTLSSPWAQVAFLFAKHPALRCTCVSAGARLHIENALESALVELESRVFSLLNGIQLTKLNPRDVLSPDNHFELYAQARYFERADRLATPTERMDYETVCKNSIGTAHSLFEHLAANDIHPVFVDITPKLNGIRDGRERLAVARAFAPGLIPMSFGYGREPRGMVDVVRAESLFPHPFP